MGRSGNSSLLVHITLELSKRLVRVPVFFCIFSLNIKRVPGCEGLWELRERYGNTQIRLFFFQAGPNILAIIHGYVKKTKKIPMHVLKQAVQKMKEYKKE
ncbi:MAG TPA: hypothetical protein GXX19_04685 [Syntrophomonadaceae bacterium]|nr:hypothetical protein [Syntrophomonadaceae bacterium]